MTLGYHSSNYLCSYCNKNALYSDNKYCSKNVIYTKYYTIIPSFEYIKSFFYKPYYKKIE